jgi:hypothetical protein
MQALHVCTTSKISNTHTSGQRLLVPVLCVPAHTHHTHHLQLNTRDRLHQTKHGPHLNTAVPTANWHCRVRRRKCRKTAVKRVFAVRALPAHTHTHTHVRPHERTRLRCQCMSVRCGDGEPSHASVNSTPTAAALQQHHDRHVAPVHKHTHTHTHTRIAPQRVHPRVRHPKVSESCQTDACGT